MNSGTAAAKEAANMVDLDSDPSNILKVVKLGKQLLMTRGAITTFSIANDVSKYFKHIKSGKTWQTIAYDTWSYYDLQYS